MLLRGVPFPSQERDLSSPECLSSSVVYSVPMSSRFEHLGWLSTSVFYFARGSWAGEVVVGGLQNTVNSRGQQIY